jgi:hypothetical protein
VLEAPLSGPQLASLMLVHLLTFAFAGFYFWFVYEYTGVNGFINGLSNL